MRSNKVRLLLVCLDSKKVMGMSEITSSLVSIMFAYHNLKSAFLKINACYLKMHCCTNYICCLNRFWMTFLSGLHCVFIKVLKPFILSSLQCIFYPAEHVEPTQVKYICMKIAASFIICNSSYTSTTKKKTNLWIQARKKKFLPGLSLVHCLFER